MLNCIKSMFRNINCIIFRKDGKRKFIHSGEFYPADHLCLLKIDPCGIFRGTAIGIFFQIAVRHEFPGSDRYPKYIAVKHNQIINKINISKIIHDL